MTFFTNNKTQWPWNLGPTLPTYSYPSIRQDTYTPFNIPNSSTDIKRFEAAQKILAKDTKKDLPITKTLEASPTKKKAKKEKIPATLKNILWHKYFDTSLTGVCQCCKVELISKAIFDAGHVISEKNGGQVVLENLKPICKLCNSSMGKTNMDDFMKKYGI
jgi:hypothetical protein